MAYAQNIGYWLLCFVHVPRDVPRSIITALVLLIDVVGIQVPVLIPIGILYRYTDTDTDTGLFCNTGSDTDTDMQYRFIIGSVLMRFNLRTITRALLQYATHSYVVRCLFVVAHS